MVHWILGILHIKGDCTPLFTAYGASCCPGVQWIIKWENAFHIDWLGVKAQVKGDQEWSVFKKSPSFIQWNEQNGYIFAKNVILTKMVDKKILVFHILFVLID